FPSLPPPFRHSRFRGNDEREKRHPRASLREAGVFAAGAMLDWEAPTGGYLLQGAFASGAAAARGVEAWLSRP
ncbi:MAG: NAD(P)/FAD-dependent oxidoreductase, partial [Rhodospirillales bacterium]|nr:NAD(P)/FAD-dependent oxidoreductase [Rhodospirillales bacterium]